MCLSKPNIPAPPPPPQEVKTPDSLSSDRRKSKPAGMGGGTILTGSQGISSSSLNTGSNTLLGS